MSQSIKEQLYNPPVAEAMYLESEPCMGEASNELPDLGGNPIYDEGF